MFGNVNISKPTLWDIEGVLKWDAWKAEQGISQKHAANMSILLLEKVLASKGVTWTWNS